MRFIVASIFLSLAVSTPAWAARWYQVELLVFAQTQPNTLEQWEANVLPQYDHNAIRLGNPADVPAGARNNLVNAASHGAWKLHPRNNNYPVAAAGRRMSGSGHYRTLFYGRWLQPISSASHSLPLYVQGGKSLAARTQLSMPDDQVTATQLPELQGTIKLTGSNLLHLSTNLWFATNRNGKRIFSHIDESRRLKSGELHYLDNPLFGVLIRVTPTK